jgi:acyl-CoA hydrolase
MPDYLSEYRSKLRTPEEAVKIVKSGDWVDYTTALGMPVLLDAALAKRADELTDVKIRGNLMFGPVQCAECDPEQRHFTYHSWHCSAYERKLVDRGMCYFIPMIFRNLVPYYRHFLDVNVAMMSVAPMDEHGYFNLSVSTGIAKGILDKADVVVLEVNERLPRVHGLDEVIHISNVDMVVEGPHGPLPELAKPMATLEDAAIAKNILPYIKNGSVLQLGIGGMPNTVGRLIAESGLRDLSMHTELCCDAYLDLYNAGALTNRNSGLQRGKGIYGIAFGSAPLYEWIRENPSLHACPLEFVNSPEVIGAIDNIVSINSCISVDLYGQVCAESAGTRQISGTGGQLDFLTGAAMSKGGKAFLCLASTHMDRHGARHSNIVPTFSGDIVTSPRSQAYFMVTEYGAVNLVGRSTWERAEMLISIAHPDYRQELIRAAEAQHIWRRSNR